MRRIARGDTCCPLTRPATTSHLDLPAALPCLTMRIRPVPSGEMISFSNTCAWDNIPGTETLDAGWSGMIRASGLPRLVMMMLSRILATRSYIRSACVLNALTAIVFRIHLLASHQHSQLEQPSKCSA